MNEVSQQTELNAVTMPEFGTGDPDDSGSSFVVKRFSRLTELHYISSEWDRLVSESETNTVHQLFAFNEIWWQVLSEGKDLFVFSVWAGKRLVGLAPLMRSVQRKHGKECRVVEFIGSGNVNYLDFITGANKRHVMTLLLDEIFHFRNEWDMLNLLHIPADSTTPELIEEYCRRKSIRARTVPFGSCPVYKCSGDIRVDLKITKKKTEQRYYNHYRKSGDFEFKICHTMAEVDTYLSAMFEQHISRFAADSRPSKYVDESQRDFVRLMTARLLPEAIPVFSVALFNGKPIATQYGFYYGDKFTGYLLTYDFEESKNSPGRLMVKLIMTEMIERGITEFDFGRGAGEYKMRFANGARENRAVMVYNDKTLGVLAALSHASQKIISKAKDVLRSKDLSRKMVERYSKGKRSPKPTNKQNIPEQNPAKTAEVEPAIIQ